MWFDSVALLIYYLNSKLLRILSGLNSAVWKDFYKYFFTPNFISLFLMILRSKSQVTIWESASILSQNSFGENLVLVRIDGE